ncbi:ABC transporter permease [Actinocorallia longicatena]|uniref:ABC transporter permease n=1 Tax=Actinocorallia longicatena TaxID=111803 RepID=A0ABP6QIC8_9ACTN
MNGLARASIRFRPVAFAGTFVALALSAAIVMACGVLLESGVRATVPAGRYERIPLVAAADQALTYRVSDEDTERIPLPGRARLDAALVPRIAAMKGVASAVGDIAVPVRDGGTTAEGRGWGMAALDGTAASLTGRPPGPGEVVLTGHAEGTEVRLVFGDTTRTFRVAGNAPGVWFADAEAAVLSGVPASVDAIAVTLSPGADVAAIAKDIEKTKGVRAYTGSERGELVEPRLAGAKEVLTGLGGSFGGVATLVAIFTAAGTIALAVAQRAREFALLRAIGATPRQVRRAVLAEGLLVAPAAALAGALPGLLLARWWFGALRERGAIPEGVRLAVSPWPLLAAAGLCLLTALLAGPLAARRAARIEPGRALAEASVERTRPGIVRTALGIGAVAGGAAMAGLAARESGEDAANLALGVVLLFMLATALLGPVIARLCAALFGLPLRGAGAPAELAAANARTNARRLASAMTPIILAMAFSSTLVFLQTSMSHATSGQVRDGITADRIVRGDLPADAVGRVRELAGVRQAVGVLSTSVLVRAYGTPQTASAQAIEGPVGAVQDLGVRAGRLEDLAPGTVAVDASLADGAKAGLGDRLRMWLPDGTETRPRIVALYGRGLGIAQITLPRADVAGHGVPGFDSMILVKGDSPDLASFGAVASRAGYAEQYDVDLAVNAWANNTMAAVLGGFAAITALNTLVMTALDRRGEFGSMRLIGSTRRQVLHMLGWESLLVTGGAVLLGSAIAAATLIPMIKGLTGEAPYVPPLLYGTFAAATVLFGWIATVLPARAALKIN